MILFILALDAEGIAKLASAFQLFIFVLVNLAVVVMRESGLPSYDPGYRSPLYPWMQIFGIVTSVLLIVYMGWLAILFTAGITALIAPPLANPLDPTAGHKTLNYWPRLRTLRQAATAGAGEAIWLNLTNHLAGGAVSNIFLVKAGRLLTPYARGEETQGALPAPVLPGITRAAIIELAAQHGLEVERRMLSVEDLLDADEVFLTNSGWGVLPVSKVEKKQIGGGAAGEITTKLRAGLLELIDRETGEE